MKKGITLTETIVIFVALGLLLIIFIPKCFHNYKESLNRMKIKKTMNTYDDAITKIVVDNDLRTEIALKEWGKNTNTCDNTIKYFQYKDREGCIFKTANGIFWDISDITKPLIAFTRKDLEFAQTNGTDGQKSFMLAASFDNSSDTLKVNDLEFESIRLKKEFSTDNNENFNIIYKPQEEKRRAEIQSEIELKISELKKIYNYIAKNSSSDASN